MPYRSLATHLCRTHAVIPPRPNLEEASLTDEDPALAVIVDFHWVCPVTVEPDRSIDEALQHMIGARGRTLLVLATGHVIGLITAYDIQGQTPPQFLHGSDCIHPKCRHLDIEVARHRKSFVALDGANHLLTGRQHAAYAAGVIAAWVQPWLPEATARDALVPGQVRVVESGASRYTQWVQAGRHDLIADEPTSIYGEGAGPGPFDCLLAALGACTTMTLRMVAERKGWPLDPVEVTLSQQHIHTQDCTDCESREGKVLEIERAVRLPRSLDPAIAQQLMAIADRCSVHRPLLYGLPGATGSP